MAIKYHIALLVLCFGINLCIAKDSLRGHNQPLGMQRDPDGHIDILASLPTAKEFWQKYLSTSTPVLIRSAIISSPAFKLWTDDYLKTHFGNMTFKIEDKTNERGKPIGILGIGFDQLYHFLDTYKNSNASILSQIPTPMQHDILALPFMTCGSIANRLRENHIWLSAGPTQSQLHSDPTFTLNCLLAGQKDWIFIHSKYHKYLNALKTDDKAGRLSPINVNKVNLHRYPHVGKIPWKFANATPGDCIYVPRGYFHQVRSKGSRNMAYTILFDISDEDFKTFNSTDCDHIDSIKMTKMSMSWRYSGYGSMTFGNSIPILRTDEWIERIINRKSKVSTSMFQRILQQLKKWINFSQKDITRQQFLAIPLDAYNEIIALEDLEENVDNDLNYEAILLDHNTIRQIAKESIDSAGDFDQEKFIKRYKEIGGSDYFASKFIKTLDEDKNGIVDKNEVQRNLLIALEIYKDTAVIEEQEARNKALVDNDDYNDNDLAEDSRMDETDKDEENDEMPKDDDDIQDREYDIPESKDRILDEL